MEQKQIEMVIVKVGDEEVEVLASRDLLVRALGIIDRSEWYEVERLSRIWDSATEDADAVLCLDARTGQIVEIMSPEDDEPWNIELARLSAAERDAWSPDQTDMVAALNTLCVEPEDICSHCETYEDVMQSRVEDWDAQSYFEALRGTWCDDVTVDDNETIERTLEAISRIHGSKAANDAKDYLG